jgi:hypothetical protein
MDRIAEQARDHPALAVAEGLLAMHFENVGDAAAGGGLDLAVGIDEGQAEMLRQRLPMQLLPAPISPTRTIVRSRLPPGNTLFIRIRRTFASSATWSDPPRSPGRDRKRD